MNIYNPDGTLFMAVTVDDESYRFQELMGKDELVLKFSLPEHKEIPAGAYCIYPEQAGGARYTLLQSSNVIIRHSRSFEYTVTLEGVRSNLRKHKLYNPVDGRLKFDYTAQSQEHLQLLVDNLNDRYGEGSWDIGGYVQSTEKLISYSHNNLLDVLNAIAETFNTEWEIYTAAGVHYISLGRVEHGVNNPLPLSYGKGKGFVSGISRTNYDDNLPIGRLFIQGGERNIDYSKYPSDDPDEQHSRSLLLPRSMTFSFDGERFSDEDGYNSDNGIQMVTDDKGFSVVLDDAPDDVNEDSLDLTDIYPKRVGRVTQLLFWDSKAKEYVEESAITDWDVIEYDIVDSTIPSDLDFSACLMDGETMTLIFQNGMLASREFEVKYHHAAVDERPAKRFEIVKETFDGQQMPSEYYLPVAGDGTTTGDQYAVFGVMLPAAYIASKTADGQHTGKYIYEGAEYEALRQAARFLYENRGLKFTFKGVLDGIYAKRNWANIASSIVIGGCIRFTDESIVGEEQHYDLRIASVKEYLNNPHSPTIELTDEAIYANGGLSSELRKLEGEDVHAEAKHRDSIIFTRRTFRDAKETATMLQNAFAGAFGSAINPVTVHTMQLLAGDEHLQFRFWQNANCTGLISNPVIVSEAMARVNCTAAYIQHLTHDVADPEDITTQRPYTSYHRWHIAAQTFLFTALDPDLAYYLYAQCVPETDGDRSTVKEATYVLRSAPAQSDTEEGYFMLLVGILNSEQDGSRSYASVYGFTEILPNQITTAKIRNSDGDSFFDLEANQFQLGSNLKYNIGGNGKLVLNGTFVQSGSGDLTVVGAWCGVYDSDRTYALGDEVVYTVGGLTSTYRYVNSVPSSGHLPTNTTYWIKIAAGVKGEDGDSGQSTFKSIVFKRTNTAPDAPPSSQGSYLQPVPVQSGWSDGVPDGDAQLWMSTRVFTSDGESPQQPVWTTPQPATDTADIDFEFSAVANNPGNPTDNPGNWHNTATSSDIWMAVRKSKNGVWGDWEISKIKGENGADGQDGRGISNTLIAYAVSESGSIIPVAGWQDSSQGIPSCPAGFYLWTRTTIVYTSGSDSVSYTSSRQGENGLQGPTITYQGEWKNNVSYHGNEINVDIVLFGDQYFISKTTAGTIPVGTEPTNTVYWMSFGASFNSVATGLLFSEEAVIDNLVTKILETAKNGKRIVARENILEMYDASDNQRLLVHGEPLSDVPLPTTQTISSQQIFSQNITSSALKPFWTKTDNKQVLSGLTLTSGANIITFASLSLRLNISSMATAGSCDWTVKFFWMVDGVQVGQASPVGRVTTSSSNRTPTVDVTIPSFKTTLGIGTHVVQIGYTVNAYPTDDYATTYSSSVSGTMNASGLLTINYSTQLTEIGSNGFRAMFGTEYMFSCIKTGSGMGSIELMLRAGDFGIRVNDAGIKMLFDGAIWWNASRQYNSTLGGSYLKLE